MGREGKKMKEGEVVNIAGTQIEANAAMRAYVMGDSGLNQSESTVCINVSHSNLKTKFIELRLDKHMTILEVMEKLRRHTGSGVEHTVLQLYNQAQQLVCTLEDGLKTFPSSRNMKFRKRHTTSVKVRQGSGWRRKKLQTPRGLFKRR